MKTLQTGVRTHETTQNGITKIEVKDPIYYEGRFIKKNEFKYLMTLINYLHDSETDKLSFDLNGYKCKIVNNRVTELSINGQQIYLTVLQLKQINSLYKK